MDSTHAHFAGGIPENYDHGLGPHIFVDFAHDLASRVAAESPRRILELASGTGIVTRLLRDAVHDECELVATDLHEPMLDVAKQKFEPSDRVSFRQANALDLPFEDEHFDTVVCQFGVMFFPDKVASYREALRVLQPSGRYVFNVWGSFEHNPFSRIAHETVCEFFPKNPPGFYRVPFSYHDAGEITSALEDAGFADISISVEQRQTTVEDFDRFAHGLVFGNPLVEEVRNRGGVDPETLKGAIASALRRELGEGPGQNRLRSMVIRGVRPR